jgi:phosphatidate phosphatase APP1
MLFAKAPLRVQPFFGFRTTNRLFLSSRAVRSHEPVFQNRNVVGDVATILGQYASREVSGLEIELEFHTADGGTLRQSATTGPEGYARFDLAFAAPIERPKQTTWEKAVLRWETASPHARSGEITAHILAPGRTAGIGIISDIDDTIMETGITGNVRAILRNWKRILVQMPSERLLVPGAQDFFAALGGQTQLLPDLAGQGCENTPQARARPVFYVSSSPWNLFSYLVAFKSERNLPLGPIMLRNWGFNRNTLGHEGHGTHKRDAIMNILSHYPDLRFAMVGDDMQKDLFAFAEVAARYPDRIAAIFIRSISKNTPSEAQQAARSAIEKAGVPFWTGSDYTAAKGSLAAAGLVLDGQLKDLLRTLSQAAPGGHSEEPGER